MNILGIILIGVFCWLLLGFGSAKLLQLIHNEIIRSDTPITRLYGTFFTLLGPITLIMSIIFMILVLVTISWEFILNNIMDIFNRKFWKEEF